MSQKNHFAALQEIRNWNTDDVISALKNNGLGECVDACMKRDITGDKLLELSEMKLGLWKCDLTIGNIRKLAVFIQDICKMPAKYTTYSVSSNSDDAWDTDFDDDETEEDNRQKTDNNIPHGVNSKHGLELSNGFHPEKRNSSVQNIVHKIHNSQLNDNRLSPVSRNRFSQSGKKINIPSPFSSVSPSQNGSSKLSLVGNITKAPYLKVNSPSEPARNDFCIEPKTIKPTIPPQPPNQHKKSSPKSISVQSALPKPPPFDNEGLREICDKLQSQFIKHDTDYETEYDSIDDEILFAREENKQVSQNHKLIESESKSPLSSESEESQQETLKLSTLHQNQSKQLTISTQSRSEVVLNTTVENLRKSPILPPTHTNKQDGALRASTNLPFVSQGKLENTHIHKAAFLPTGNEIRQDVSPTSTLHRTALRNCNRTNECFTTGTSVTKRLSKEYDDNKDNGEKTENGVNEQDQEEKYEIIEDVESRICNKYKSRIDSDGYLSPIVPPKIQQAPSNVKINNVESNGAVGGLWPFGSQKNKSQQKHPGKVSPNGKKTSAPSMLRPMNGPYVSDSPRPSASRPLPPTPVNGGVQRLAKVPVELMPWYFNVDRARGEEILRNCEDGIFMIRPSTQTENAFTLTLKYGNRPFNIGVRHRSDGRFALGTAKPTEQTFSSVEELVNYYTSSELILYSNGNKAGIVVLTSPPRKDALSQ